MIRLLKKEEYHTCDKCIKCTDVIGFIENEILVWALCRDCLFELINLFPIKFVEAHPYTECKLRGCDK